MIEFRHYDRTYGEERDLSSNSNLSGRRRGEVAAEVPPDRRSDALSEILAARAARHPSVQAFRKTALGGRLIAPAAVGRWLEKHGVRGEPSSETVLRSSNATISE